MRGEFKKVQADVQVYQLSSAEKRALYDAFIEYDSVPVYLGWGSTKVILDYDTCPPYIVELAKFDTRKEAEIALEAYKKSAAEMWEGWAEKTREARAEVSRLSDEFIAEWAGVENE